jgi:hypothetical protein
MIAALLVIIVEPWLAGVIILVAGVMAGIFGIIAANS